MLEATKASLPEDLKLQVHVKGRNEDGAAQMAALLAALKESSGATPAVGWLPKEKPEGDLMTRWARRGENVTMATECNNLQAAWLGWPGYVGVSETSLFASVPDAWSAMVQVGGRFGRQRGGASGCGPGAGGPAGHQG
jgi:hypothetical protein